MTELLILPMPPSVNNLFMNVKRGRAITPEYKAWRLLAGLKLKSQHPKPVKGRVSVNCLTGKGATDLDNRWKALLDLLVEYGVIEGDGPGIVRELHMVIADRIEGIIVKVLPI